MHECYEWLSRQYVSVCMYEGAFSGAVVYGDREHKDIGYIHTYIRTYIHTYVHTYIHTYMHT